MKAIVRTKYGPPETLQLKEVPKPAPKSNEVLVKIYATTVNRTDCAFLRGKPFINRLVSGFFRPKRKILGNEFAGEIEAVGKDAKSFKVADHVFGFSGISFGAHAEYMTTSEQGMLTTMPANMTYEEAALSTEGAHYALNNIRKANVRSGQKVLIIRRNRRYRFSGSPAIEILRCRGYSGMQHQECTNSKISWSR